MTMTRRQQQQLCPRSPARRLLLLLALLGSAAQLHAAGSLPSRSKIKSKLKAQVPNPPPPPPPPPPPDNGAGSQVSTYVTFHDSAGTPIQLYKKTWDRIVKETSLEPMDLEPAEAMHKEREMNQRVSSGEQDESAWHQHQYVMASTGNVDSARILMEYGVGPSVQKMSQEGGASPLQQAALTGNYDEAEQILAGGETGVVLHEMSQEPLVAAAMMGHADIVGLLLREGHDTEVTGANGATPLMVAASMGHLLVLDVLIQHGAQLDARHKFAGSTAIHFAAEMGEVAAVKRLCAAGADVESEKTHGGRAIHTAADTNQPDVITALLECGAKRNALLMEDTTALYLAAQNGFTEVARALVEHKCESDFCLAQKEAAALDFEMPTGPESSQVSTKMDGAFGSVKSFFESGNGATALHAACENGHLGVVKVLAKNGVDVNSRGMQGVTPLYSCISYNHPDITSFLVKRAKADVNRRMKKDGDTPLMIAIKFARGTSAHIPILLASRDIDLEVRNKAGQTVLMVAVGMGRHDIVNQLLLAGADASASVKSTRSKKDQADSGGTVLHVAVEQGNSGVVEQLIAAGADVHALGADGATLLVRITGTRCERHLKEHFLAVYLESSKGEHAAAESGWRGKNSIELLLKYGLEYDARIVSSGATALMMAARSGAEDSVKLLLKAGAKVNAKAGESLYGMTALYMACQDGRLESVKALLDGGAKVSQRLDKYKVTPLAIAAERGHKAIVEHLLRYGGARGGIEMKDQYGRSALAAAAQAEQVDIVKVLSKEGADVDTENKQGLTPLMVAVRDEKAKVVEALLELGAEEDVENAMEYARVERLFDMMKLLQPYAEETDDEEVHGEL